VRHPRFSSIHVSLWAHSKNKGFETQTKLVTSTDSVIEDAISLSVLRVPTVI
jgi:hypothetical protein